MTTTDRTGRPPRGAFTLIELLVVIAIMAVLAAVAVGTYFRIQGDQVAKGTENRIKNLNAGLARQWTATLDTGRKEFRDNVGNCKTILTTYCGGDQDRALSLWLYLKVKNEFPQTFDEARQNVSLGGVTLNAKKTFEKLPNTIPADATEAAHQSAVILYILMTERAARGEMYGEEAIGAGAGTVTVSGGTFPVFNDLWGNPLAYVRFATNSEINDRPFIKPGTASNDPLDPAGKLGGSWTNVSAAARTVFGPGRSSFPNANWMVTVVSSGPDQADDGKYVYASVDFSRDVVPPDPLPADPSKGLGQVSLKAMPPDKATDSRDSFISVRETKDDILGYRLRQEGQGGN